MKKTMMKNKIWLVLIAMITAGSAFADESSIAIAPKLGVTSFNIANSGLGAKSGRTVGAEVLIPVGVNDLQVLTGINYLESGAKTNIFFAESEIDLKYFTLPAMAQYSFLTLDTGAKFYAKAGVVAAKLLSAKQKASTIFGSSYEQDIKGSTNGLNIQANVGMGANFPVFEQKYRLGFDLTHVRGLNNTFRDQASKATGWILASSLAIPL